MEIKRVALVMVDISGYTRFTRLHTTSLLHAEMIITELLETVLNQAEYPLTLSKLEGDAAFLYVVLDQDDQRARAAVQNVTQQVMSFFDAFRSKERELVACDACVCEACRNISKLQLKAFLHIGQAAFKQIRQFEELAGEDVIIIHRLMKNTTPAKEYTLMTEAYYDMSGGMDVGAPETRTVDCEGIGEVVVKVYYPAAPEAPFPPPAVSPSCTRKPLLASGNAVQSLCHLAFVGSGSESSILSLAIPEKFRIEHSGRFDSRVGSNDCRHGTLFTTYKQITCPGNLVHPG